MFRTGWRTLSRRAPMLLLLAAFAGPAGGEAGVDGFRGQMEKWVETRQLISLEKTDWELERETLRASRDLLQDQREALKAEIEELSQSSTAADEERADLLLRREDSQTASFALQQKIRGMEERILALAPKLPEPLQERLEVLLVQIPENPDTTRQGLGQRLMNVLGVLSQAEKFNGTATFVGETRAVEGDQRVQVRTLYWGLGQAFYVDARGQTAGIGRPGAQGWEFTDDPDLADAAKRLLDIYEGNVDVIEFVDLPVEIR